MERIKRYFVSFMFFKKDGTYAHGSTVINTIKFGWDIQEELKTIITKQEKEFIEDVVILNFQELKQGEFEDVK